MWMLNSKNISLITLTVSMKETAELSILTIHVVYSDYAEILRQLDLELKTYYIWHLKFETKFLKSSKELIFRNQNVSVTLVQNICDMLVSLIILVLLLLFSYN